MAMEQMIPKELQGKPIATELIAAMQQLEARGVSISFNPKEIGEIAKAAMKIGDVQEAARATVIMILTRHAEFDRAVQSVGCQVAAREQFRTQVRRIIGVQNSLAVKALQ